MKKFGLKIVSTFTTLAVGLVAASIVRLLPAPAARVQHAYQVEYQDEIINALRQLPTSYGVYKESHAIVPSWTAKKNETFIKESASQRIKFDPVHSEMVGGFGTPFDGGPVTSTDFLQYNYRELARIAAGGNAKQKAWLRIYLDACDESALKQSLLAALRGAQP